MSDRRGELVIPRDEESVAALLAECAARGHGVVVSAGKEPRGDDRVTLSPAALDAVDEHAAGDQTLTCGAGLTVAALDGIVAPAAQRLGLEPPQRRRATVGGVVAAAREGFIGVRFGRVRDQVLGLRVVTARGEVAVFGGRVVKNVTGYDAVRLLTGSRGVLGVITQATLRLRPLPPGVVTVVVERDSPAAAVDAALVLRAAPTSLSALAVAGGTAVASGRGPWLAAARYEGSPGALEDAVSRARRALGDAHTQEETESADRWRELTDFAPTRPVRFAMHARPSRLAHAAGRLEDAAEAAFGCVADVGCGRLEVTLDEPDDAVERLVARMTPPPSPIALEIERRLAERVDPAGILGATAR